ncbi:WXG100 family type VII secretion target [Rhodococcus sp. MEB064]|uniref:WXG100 family type VII secretion target n=1 Tax=Rhodococcus sp. MEB064 TaxID=1587522 RepID=UPI0006963994|nr:WXG100 family type VII secretion target [Rhodococcus sp. MEB064]
MSGYRADLAELDSVVARLAHMVATTRSALAEVTTRVDALPWDGAAADAHRAVHAAWASNARDMTEGVESMRRAAQRAHSSYTAAVDANLLMFGRR